MLKQEFINRLSALLHDLYQPEKDKVIAYYLELISDKVESGQDEATIISEFGDIQLLAEGILADSPNFKVNENKKSPLVIVLLCIFSPVILALFISFLALAFSLSLAAFLTLFSFFLASFAFAIGGTVCIFGSFILINSNFILASLQIAAGFILTGLSIFTFIGTYKLVNPFNKLVSLMFGSLKNIFTKRGVKIEK